MKSVSDWAAAVTKLGFDGIVKDNELRNAVSKSREKAYSKEVFKFLSDKGDARKRYATYIEKTNEINLPDSLLKELKEAKDEKEFKKIMDNQVNAMAKDLFKTNVGAAVKTQTSFIAWVELQNKPTALKLQAALVKTLGIKGKVDLLKAIIEQSKGGDFVKKAKKIAVDLETSEKKKDVYKAIEAAVKSA